MIQSIQAPGRLQAWAAGVARAGGVRDRRRLQDAEIRQVRANGRRLVGGRMVLYVAPVPGAARAAFVAGRRVGTAVERNRARRVLREAWRRVRASIPARTGVVIVARRAILPARTQELETEMRQLLTSGPAEG